MTLCVLVMDITSLSESAGSQGLQQLEAEMLNLVAANAW